MIPNMKRLFYFISTFFAAGANAASGTTVLPLPNGSAMVYEYEDEDILSIERIESNGEYYRVEMQDTWWDELVYYANKGLNFLRTDLNYGNYIQADVDTAAHTFLGATSMQMMGYWRHSPCTGTYGEGEVGDKVRVSFINGILNTRVDLARTVDQLSMAHGGVNIHYVFHPTEGWAQDLLNGFLAKMGYVSHQARQLSEIWRSLIEEMGGPKSDGIIVHYAHSIGGTDTQAAMSLMTEDELKMIHVVTLGSPTMLANEHFASVENYASVRDGVSLLDPIGYLEGLWNEESNVHFIGTWWGMPIVEHPLDREAYKLLLDELGARFQDKYTLEPAE